MKNKAGIKKYVCIHGHFYQPFRENPWTEEIDIQDEAYPYKDWNERITAECYSANAFARILNEEGKIKEIFNNYSRMSFNFGSSLVAWLKKNEYDTYERLIKADYESREIFSGHGSAIAQIYNHIIMPLANKNDKILQVSWAIYDFENHFGRKPEGMWIAETAVDYETLEVLADFDIKYTILSPYQALRYRKIKVNDIKTESNIISSNCQEKWIDTRNGIINTRRPYLCRLPSGKSMTIFFYDKDISTAVSFGDLLKNGDRFASNIMNVAELEENSPEIIVIASDGEVYGHHKKFGDMALAYCLNVIEKSNDIELTIFGEYLEKFPVEFEVEIIEKSAWSCSHSLSRWEGSCTCGMPQNPPDGKWSQEWRISLREAVSFLRNKIDDIFSSNIKKYIGNDIKNPLDTLEKYICVISERNVKNINRFLSENSLDFKNTNIENNSAVSYIHDCTYGTDERMLLSLMEMQRQAMLMQSSDAWFFDDISRIEVIQVLIHALRAIEFASLFSDENIENIFVEILRKAKSNVLDGTNGADIFLKEVTKKKYLIESIAAHFIVMLNIEFLSKNISNNNKEILSTDFEYQVFDFYEHEIKIIDFNQYVSNKEIAFYGEISIISKVNLEKESYFFISLNDNLESYRMSDEKELLRILLGKEFILSKEDNKNGSFSDSTLKYKLGILAQENKIGDTFSEFKKNPSFKYYNLKNINDRLKIRFFDEYMLTSIKRIYEDLRLHTEYKKSIPDSLKKWTRFKFDTITEDEIVLLLDSIKIFILLDSEKLDNNGIDELEFLVDEYRNRKATFCEMLPVKIQFFSSSVAKQDKALKEMLALYQKNPSNGLILALIVRLIRIYEKLGLDLDYWGIQNIVFKIKENIKILYKVDKANINEEISNNLVFLFDFFKISPDL